MLKRYLFAGAVVLLATGSLFAQATPPVSAAVSGGNLSIGDNSASLTFAATLDGTDLAIGASGTAPVFTMIDARGLRPTAPGSGWNVTLQMTDLLASGGPETIPAASMAFTTAGGTIARVAGQGGANIPTKVVFSGSLAAPAKKIVTTGAGQGRGTYTYTSILGDYTLTIPAETIADTYTGTLTATVVAGP